MVKIYLMRHGQTLFNSQGRVQGWCDSPLTPLGIEQAKAAKTYFLSEGIVFDEAYSSTQERATDTAKVITDLPVTQLKGLKEMNFGIFEAQPEMLLPKFRQGAKSFEDLLVPYGGEAISEVGKRVKNTLVEVAQSSESERILMVSHGAAIWGLIQNEGFTWPDGLGLSNCMICELVYDDQGLNLTTIIDPLGSKIITVN